MKNKKTDWFLQSKQKQHCGELYESKAIPGHNYYMSKKIEHFILKASNFLGDLSSKKLLDYGCGTGETTAIFEKEFSNAVGCDTSQSMLEQAKERSSTLDLHHLNGAPLPIEDNFFDISSMFGVMHHIMSASDIDNALGEIHRTLKPNGILAIYEFNPINPAARHIVNTCEIDAAVNLDGYRKNIFPTTFYHWELKEILNSNSFEVIENNFILIFPWFMSFFNPLERLFWKVPIGNMSVTFGRKM